jgi:uncharacterized membrane protein YfcA
VIVLEILAGLLALSFGAAFVGAISGLGGGVFIVPALIIIAHMPMPVAVGASLISVVATSAGASVAFVRDGWTNLKVAMVLECATVTGAVTGAYLAGIVPVGPLLCARGIPDALWDVAHVGAVVEDGIGQSRFLFLMNFLV